MSKNLLGNTVYLTNDEYVTLIANGSVTLASGASIVYSENDIYIVPEVIDTTVTSDSTNPVTSGAVYSALSKKQNTGNYFTYQQSSAQVAEETKTVYKITEGTVYSSGGLIVGGDKNEIGLAVTNICGVTEPTGTGSCKKTNLYLNYNSNNVYQNQVILGASKVGDSISGASYLYKYTAVRGDQMVSYVKKIVPDGSKLTDTTYTLTQDSSDGHKLIFAPSTGDNTTITIPDNNTWRGIQNNLSSSSTEDSLSANQGRILNENKVNKEYILPDGINLNTVTASGFYRLQSTLTNGPNSSMSHGQLLVVHGGGDTISQFAMPYSSSVVYVRNGNAVDNTSGTWKAWVELANTTAVTTETTARINADNALNTSITNHVNNTSNPHGVTKAQVGLGNVVNAGQVAVYDTKNSSSSVYFTQNGAYNLYSWANSIMRQLTDTVQNLEGNKLDYVSGSGAIQVSEVAEDDHKVYQTISCLITASDVTI